MSILQVFTTIKVKVAEAVAAEEDVAVDRIEESSVIADQCLWVGLG